MIGLRKI